MKENDLKSSLTPMMKQYYEIKSSFKDEIVFFRLGDFYEMFEKDAEIASKILDIALTQRNGIQMCGIPYHAKSIYIQRLLNQGYKIVMCEQLEKANEKEKGIVKRGVTEIITPGTLLEDRIISNFENPNQYIFSFFYEKIQDYYDIGIAYIDITTGDFFVSDFRKKSDLSVVLDDMMRVPFCELVLPNKAKNDPNIFKLIQNYYPNIIQNYMEDIFFSFESCQKFLIEFFEIKNLESFGFKLDSKLSILSAAALIQYIKKIQPKKLEHIHQIQYIKKTDFLYMNAKTIKHLELIENQDGKQYYTLFKILSENIKTTIGSRLLYRWILHPIVNKEDILERYNVIHFLSKDIKLLSNIQNKLDSIHDLERIISKIALKKANFRDLMRLKNSFLSIQKIRDIFSTISLDTLKKLFEEQNSAIITEIIQKLNESIDENNIESEYIKYNYSPELDKLRELNKNSEKLLIEIQDKERKKTNIPMLKIKYNNIIGYFIEITFSKIKEVKLPDYYIKKQTLKNVMRYTIPELIEYESKIMNIKNEISILEEKIFTDILEFFSDKLLYIKKMAYHISWLDVLSSFSSQAMKYDYIQPEIIETGNLEIREGRHPLVERIIDKNSYISNDLLMNKEDSFIHIITGPNMSGKSTFLRQNCLIIIMAQIGSFVPASYAKIPITDQIFTRVGATDSISKGESTFLVEMIETANILNSISPRSFIIMDEVGRGTSTYDGMAIAYSIISYLRKNFQKYNYILFSTHYHELTQLNSLGIMNYKCQILEKEDTINFLYKIVKGTAEKSYGIYVAKIAGIPQEIIHNANLFLKNKESKRRQTDLFDIENINIYNYKEKEREKERDLKNFNMLKNIVENFSKLNLEFIKQLENMNKMIEEYKKNISSHDN